MITDYGLLIDLHKQGHRQGPGREAETEKAINLATIDRTAPVKIADIGCGTGASALVLAKCLNAKIMMVDFLQDFLSVLKEKAENMEVADRISTYNIGFEKGVADWRRYLKTGGLLVVSEITWMTDSLPWELQDHWIANIPKLMSPLPKDRC